MLPLTVLFTLDCLPLNFWVWIQVYRRATPRSTEASRATEISARRVLPDHPIVLFNNTRSSSGRPFPLCFDLFGCTASRLRVSTISPKEAISGVILTGVFLPLCLCFPLPNKDTSCQACQRHHDSWAFQKPPETSIGFRGVCVCGGIKMAVGARGVEVALLKHCSSQGPFSPMEEGALSACWDPWQAPFRPTSGEPPRQP